MYGSSLSRYVNGAKLPTDERLLLASQLDLNEYETAHHQAALRQALIDVWRHARALLGLWWQRRQLVARLWGMVE